MKVWEEAQPNLIIKYDKYHYYLAYQEISQLVLIPDWLYIHMPDMLRKHFRPGAIFRGYRSPAYVTLLSLRKEPILAAKELVLAHSHLLTEDYTYLSKGQSGPSKLQNRQSLQVRKNPPSNTTTTLGTRTENSTVRLTVRENRTNLPNSIDRDGTNDVAHSGCKIDPKDGVNVSLADQAKWLARMGHACNTNVRYLAREIIAASVVMLSQQLCVITVLIFYSSSVPCHPGQQTLYSVQPMFLSWGVTLANVMIASPAYHWIETMGAKWLMLAILPLLSVLIAAAAASFEVPQGITQQALVGLFTYGFTAVYSFAMGSVPSKYSADIFPPEHRIISMSWAVSINFLGAGILAFFLPVLQTSSILLGIFAGLNLCVFIAVWNWVPRNIAAPSSDGDEAHTVALDLSQLVHIFRKENWTHGRYMSQVYLRYFWSSFWAGSTGENAEQPRAFHVWNRDLERYNGTSDVDVIADTTKADQNEDLSTKLGHLTGKRTFKWPTQRIQTSVPRSRGESLHDVFAQLTRGLMRVSRDNEALTMGLSIDCKLECYLKDRYGLGFLADLICVNSDSGLHEASTLGEYIACMWPTTGWQFLRVLEEWIELACDQTIDYPFERMLNFDRFLRIANVCRHHRRR